MMIQTIQFVGIILLFINLIPSVTGMTVNNDPIDVRFASSIQIDDVLKHLNEFQAIATASNGNRAAKTIGFNRTLDYITNFLALKTNFK
ncbi:unnamed protein product, partial [Rotaria magnacalcarata]